MPVTDTTRPVGDFIADVLRRAHQTAEAGEAFDEERTILRLAHLFAEDLAKTDPGFDRLEFVEAITESTASTYEKRLTT
jgi:hypothetical protein